MELLTAAVWPAARWHALAAARAAGLVEALAHGVAAAHRVDVVHRDLKPSNILLADDDTPKIADFGLVKLMDSEAEDPHRRLGGLADVHGPRAGDGARWTGRPSDRHPRPGRHPLRADHRPAAYRGATLSQTLEQVKSSEPVPPSRLVPGLPRDVETIC